MTMDQGDSPDHFFTQRSFILSWHTIIIVGAVAKFTRLALPLASKNLF